QTRMHYISCAISMPNPLICLPLAEGAYNLFAITKCKFCIVIYFVSLENFETVPHIPYSRSSNVAKYYRLVGVDLENYTNSYPSVFLTLVCETAAFYPENLTFTWFKNGTEITTGIHTIKRQNTEGLFEASSSVEETQSVQNGTVYTCCVSHISLQTPGIRNYTICTVYLPDKGRNTAVSVSISVKGLLSISKAIQIKENER
uniref:Ig-like domain-containing protein n=1 Tax=Callorhinchus milii TaxID=7868 RepID=A0A4W3H5G0_CALMI